MKNEEDTDRLLSEKEIIGKARERFGLGAVKIEELLRDCTEVKTMPIKYPYCEEFPKKGSHDKYWEEH